MSEPQDSATTLLTDASEALKTVYHPELFKMMSRMGRATNKLLSKVPKRKMHGGRFEVKVQSANAYGWQGNADPNSDFPKPAKMEFDYYYVTFSDKAAENDLRKVSASIRVSDVDLQRKGQTPGAAVDFVEETIQNWVGGYSETMAVRNNIGSDGKVFSVNGTPRQNDKRRFADASVTPAANTGARVPIDGGSFAIAKPGLTLDHYTGSTKDGTVRVIDSNAEDKSVGFYGVDANGNIDKSISLSGLADNDDFYLAGEKDNNILGMEEWFNPDPTSGESFFGKDRTLPEVWRWMRPYQEFPGGLTGTTGFALAHIDSMFTNAQFIEDDPEGGFMVRSQPDLHQAFRDEVGNDALIQRPSKKEQGALIADYGFDGLLYRHPITRFTLEVDPLMQPNRIDFLRPGTWELINYVEDGSNKPFRVMPGLVGVWNRLPSSTPGNGGSMFWQAEGYTLACTICTAPAKNMQLRGVTA